MVYIKYSKNIVMIVCIGCSVPSMHGLTERPIQPQQQDIQPVTLAETAHAGKAGQVLQAIDRLLAMNGVTNSWQLKPIVDMLEKARELVRMGDEHLDEAVALLEKAQDQPGSKTVIPLGTTDIYGHPRQLSMWRMLALVRNGKDPSSAE